LRLIGFLGSSGCGNWPSPFFFVCFWRFRFHRRHFWKKNLGFISLAGGGARVLCGCDFTQTGHTLNIFASFLIFSKFFQHFIVNIMGIFVQDDDPEESEAFIIFYWKAKTFVQLEKQRLLFNLLLGFRPLVTIIGYCGPRCFEFELFICK